MKKEVDIKYSDLFWLFIIASWAGLLLEGFYCLLKFGKWENHVVSVYGHFCIIYGVGIVFYYTLTHYIKKYNVFLRFFLYAFLGTFIELICGLLLKYGLNMMAWSYENCFLNFMGLICFRMFIIWGILGFVFEKTNKYTDKFVRLTRKKVFNFIVPFFTIFMIFNLSITTVAIIRWSHRHNYGSKPSNAFTKYIDKKYNDKYMQKRFIEWYFIDDKKAS